MLPWESMKGLENQDIYRMPSVSSILYTYQKCDKSQRKAVRDRASYATLDMSDAYYVINPTGDLRNTKNPQFVYLRGTRRRSHLMGCCSGLLELNGPYTPKGALIDYLLAGSPIVIGNLWAVAQTWALEFTKKLLETFEGEMENEAGIVACLDLARKTSNILMYRSVTICYGVPNLLRKRIP
ncbi:separase [Tanacetum coccineum]